MEIRFSSYRFLTDTQVLYKDREIIALKQKQAEMLSLFLSNPDTIFSKETLLNKVWKNQEVSEQVIFQNISALRSVLGEGAIKTFPKKGYKWQLELTQQQCDTVDTASTKSNNQPSSTSNAQTSLSTKLPWYLIALCALIATFVFFWGPFGEPKTPRPLPDEFFVLTPTVQKNAAAISFKEILDAATHNKLAIRNIAVSMSVTEMFATPLRQSQVAQLSSTDWLAWGAHFESEQGQFLQYALVKGRLVWQGFIFGSNQSELTRNFNERLQQLTNLGLFQENVTQIDEQLISNMLTQAPKDLNLLLQIAELQVNKSQFDVALAYLSKLQSQATEYADSPYLAKALWLKGKVFKMQSQHEQAFNSLSQMAEVSRQTPIWPLNFENIKTSALLAYEEQNIDEMMSILHHGMKIAQRQADPYTRFELHTLFSMLAENTGFDVEKYDQLNQAQAILLKHQLDDANKAIVYFYFAKFTEDNEKAIPYLEQVLSLPRSAQNYWQQDEALAILVNYYLEQEQYEQAQNKLSQSTNTLHKKLLQANVLLAQNLNTQAYEALLQTFEAARLEHKRHIGIEAAYMLYSLTASEPELQAEFKAYLVTNAKESWLKQRNILLASP